MPIDQTLQSRLVATFKPLNTDAAAKSFPSPETLSNTLEGILKKHAPQQSINVDGSVAKLVGTASVDMWLRAVHSFLVSAALTQTSPIWASVSGYYSSHYSIRAIAHLLGYFQLYRRKRIARFTLQGATQCCIFANKKEHDGEHAFYWRTVKADQHFNGDSLFTKNESVDASDSNHRNLANYGDHLSQYYAAFQVPDERNIKSRTDFISKISFGEIPSRSKFPELDLVQVVAYHRLIRYRQFLDEAIGTQNRFWKVYRDPVWARPYTDLQLVEQNSRPAALRSR